MSTINLKQHKDFRVREEELSGSTKLLESIVVMEQEKVKKNYLIVFKNSKIEQIMVV